MLQALLRHAVKTHYEASGARTFFNRRYAALRGLFPRSPQHWNRVLDDALTDFQKHTREHVAAELADTLQATLSLKQHHSSPGKTPMREPARQEVWEGLRDDIVNSDDQAETLAARLFQLLDQNHDYACSHGREPLLRSYFAQSRSQSARTPSAPSVRHDSTRTYDRTCIGLGVFESILLDALG